MPVFHGFNSPLAKGSLTSFRPIALSAALWDMPPITLWTTKAFRGTHGWTTTQRHQGQVCFFQDQCRAKRQSSQPKAAGFHKTSKQTTCVVKNSSFPGSPRASTSLHFSSLTGYVQYRAQGMINGLRVFKYAFSPVNFLPNSNRSRSKTILFLK